jgi:hypothetical protein
MPEKALDATVVAPFREGAEMLQAAASRLLALTAGVDKDVDAAVGRLQALPPAALIDPFAVMADAGAAVAGNIVAGTEAAAEAGAGAMGTRNSRPRTAPQRPTATPGSAARGGLQRLAEGATGDQPSIASAIALPGRLLAHLTEQLALGTPTAPEAAGISLTPLPGQPGHKAAPRPGTQPSAAAGGRARQVEDDALAKMVREVAHRFGANTNTPAAGASPAGVPAQPTPQPSSPLDQLVRRLLAGKQARSPDRGAQRRVGAARNAQAPGDPARPMPTPAPTLPDTAPARRAASLLLGGAGALGGAAAGLMPRGAAAEPTGTGAVPSAPGPVPQADPDDVIAEINRLLVDQAWLRGVDLR